MALTAPDFAELLVVFGFWPDPATGWLVPCHYVIPYAVPLLDPAPIWESPGHLSRPATCAHLGQAGGRAELPFSKVSFGTCSNSWLDQWSAQNMGVYTVSVIEAGGQLSMTPFGVLCTGSTALAPGCKYSPQFDYDIWFDDGKSDPVMIRMDYHPDVLWGPYIEHVVRAHHYATPWSEVGPAACMVALHWPDSGLALDIETMRNGPHPQAPPWLWWAHELVQRYLMLERVATLIAPVAPMPSPVQLQAALGPRRHVLQAAFGPRRDTLQMVGRDVLRLLALVAEATGDPVADAWVLIERITRLTERAHLASLVARSHILDFVELPDPGNEHPKELRMKDLAADVGEALCGSVLLEPGGNYTNVVGFWKWLAAEDGINAPPEVEHLDIALRHLGGPLKYYLGRTPTYTKLREVHMDDGGSQFACSALEVTYLGGVVLRYERVNARSQELQVGVEGAEPRWIEFDRVRETLVSPWWGWPLPHKVSAWVNRKPLAPLCKIIVQNTLEYKSLRELRTGVLIVEYYFQNELVEYLRSLVGQLGYERRGSAGDWQPLYYSQELQAIVSSLFPDLVIHNTVANWLLGMRLNLADETTLRNRGPPAAECFVDASIETVSWVCPRFHVRYRVMGIAALAGIVYASSRDYAEHWKELVYLAEQKEWRIAEPDQMSQPLPIAVTAWLRKHMKPLHHSSGLGKYAVQHWLVRQAQAPWLKEPPFIRALLPKGVFGHVAMLEASLGHSFQNQMLLARAVTHPSREQELALGLRPSERPPSGLNYQRLAIIGSAAVELIVSMHLYGVLSPGPPPSTDVTSGATHNPEATLDIPLGHAGGRRPRGSVPRLQQSRQGPLTSPPPTEVSVWLGTQVTTTKQVATWERKCALCNHLVYARSAIALGLDLALQHNSDTVARSVMHFADQVRAFGQKAHISMEGLAHMGAPVELGDVFLACVGAIVMDGQGLCIAVNGLVEAHINLCQPDDTTADAQSEEQTPSGPSNTGWEQARRIRNVTEGPVTNGRTQDGQEGQSGSDGQEAQADSVWDGWDG